VSRYTSTRRRPRRRNGWFSSRPPSYREAHWGQDGPDGTRSYEVNEPRDNKELIALGTVLKIIYVTRKGDDEEDVEYDHDFSERSPPLLVYGSDDGRLYILGGGYKVKVHGIVG
jgi:hypothetical protein